MAVPKAAKAAPISLESLLEAGCHFGHQVRRWHPRMEAFIWKAKDNIHIFDLAVTAAKLEEAKTVVTELVAKGDRILFVGTKRQAKTIIEDEAKRCQMPFVSSRWPGGLFTNWNQVKKSLQKLTQFRIDQKEGKLSRYTKKEQLLMAKEAQRLERLLGGLVGITKLPQAVFIVDTQREKTALREARQLGVKIIAMVDSNSDPDLVDYPIAANDDAVRSIKLIVSHIADAVLVGLDQLAKTVTKEAGAAKTVKKGA